MGYYMRYVVADERPVTVADIERCIARLGADYATDAEDDEVAIDHRGETIAHVTINVPGDGLFDDERDELVEFAEEGDDGAGKARVLEALRGARAIVAAQVLGGGRDTEEVLGALDPLWAWLFAERRGVLQADGEGYYSAEGRILELG